MSEPLPENPAYQRIMAALDHRLADARHILSHGYELPLSAVDAMIAHACVRYLAGLEAVNPSPQAFHERIMALWLIEQRRASSKKP